MIIHNFSDPLPNLKPAHLNPHGSITARFQACPTSKAPEWTIRSKTDAAQCHIRLRLPKPCLSGGLGNSYRWLLACESGKLSNRCFLFDVDVLVCI